MGLFHRLKSWEARVRAYFNVDPSVPGQRWRTNIYNLFFDHSVLRIVWTNLYEIAPGVYRSNQPTHRRFERMKAQGMATVLNLRGAGNGAHYLSEVESCNAIGLNLISTTLYARTAASRDEILALIKIFRHIDRPFVMHCKSGADRAGFASAIYLMVCEGKPVDVAQKMLSIRYAHVRNAKVGILDYILECYAARRERSDISFEDWIATEYDHVAIRARFEAREAPA